MLGPALWNLFLALLPIPFGVLLARRIAEADPARRCPGARSSALLVLWLLLLPNAPYLVTDLRHFLFDARWRELTHRAAHDAEALRLSALWGFAFLAYAVIGLVAMYLAVRPVQEAIRRHRPQLRHLRLPFFLVVALGVWLGLVPRFNSWDAFLRPDEVVGAALWVFTQPATLASIVGFGLLLAVLQDVLCAAADGWRLRRAGRSAPNVPPPAPERVE